MSKITYEQYKAYCADLVPEIARLTSLDDMIEVTLAAVKKHELEGYSRDLEIRGGGEGLISFFQSEYDQVTKDADFWHNILVQLFNFADRTGLVAFIESRTMHKMVILIDNGIVKGLEMLAEFEQLEEPEATPA